MVLNLQYRCFITSNDGAGSDDGIIESSEIECHQCELCKKNVGDGCDDFPTSDPLEDGCDGCDGYDVFS